MVQRDEPHTLRLLSQHHDVHRCLFTEHQGAGDQVHGDGFLVESESPVRPLECAPPFMPVTHDLVITL